MVDTPNGLLNDSGLGAQAPDVGLGLLPPAPGPLKAGFESGMAGVRSNLAGAGALVAHGIGAITPAPVADIAKSAERQALDYAAAQSEAAAQNNRQIEDVDWSSPKAVADHFKFLLGNALPSLALMFSGGVVGRGFGALAGRGLSAAGKAGALETGMLAGAVAPDVALEAGGIYPEALKTGVEAPAARAALGGAAAASLDFVPLLAAEHYLKAAGKGGFGAIARGAAKGAPIGAALEGSQELLQSVVERASAGQSLTDPDAISDYINSFAGGAAPGALFGAGIGGHRAMAPKVAPAVAPAPAVTPAAAPAAEVAPAVPLTPAEQEQADHATLATAHGQAAAQVDTLTAHLEEAKATTAASAKRLDELKTELEKPVGERRPKNEILAERKEINKQVSGAKDMIERIGGELHKAKTSMADIEPKMQAAASKIKTREILAATPTGLNPEIKPKAAPVVSDIIANPNVAAEADRMQTERAVQGVHALFREQGMPLTTTRESLATPPQGAREVALAHATEQTAPKETTKTPDVARQMQAVEPHAMRVVQPLAEIFAEAKTKTPEARAKVTKALAAAIRSVVQEAAKKPSVEAAQAHIEAKLPEALKGHGVAVDAPEIAKEINAAIAQAKTLYSKAATTGQTVTIVRHGETALNADGKIRGWQNVPLNTTGKKQAVALGKKLANAGITHILTSDLSRAEDTANEIGKTTGIAVDRFSALRPWNLGTYTGKSAKDAAATLEDHAHNKPDVPVDGGESFNSFKQRFLTGVQAALAAVPGAHVALVTHHRGERLFNAWLAKGMPTDHSVDMNVFTNWKEGIEPGTHSTHTVETPAAPITQIEFDNLPQLGKERVVDEYNRIMTAQGEKLVTRLKNLIGDRHGLTVETFIAAPGSEAGSYTRTGPLKSVISMALNAKDQLSVADHEGFHYAEDQLMTVAERRVVRDAFALDKPMFQQLMAKLRQYDTENNTHIADEVEASPAERHAYAFEFWRRGELQAEGLLNKVFEKIKQFFERVANFVRGQGFKAMEDIFTALDREQFAEREQYEPGPPALAMRAVALAKDLAADAEAQSKWLVEKAKNEGFKGVDELLATAPQRFEELAAEWRAQHPAATLFSRSGVDDSSEGLRDVLAGLSVQDRTVYSFAAIKAEGDIAREQAAGEQQQAQAFAAFTKMVDAATEHGKDNLSKTAFGAARTAGSSVTQWWQKNIATPNFISSISAGYKNVFKVLNTYVRYRNELVERMLIQKIPLWYTASNEDQKVAFAALQRRNVEGLKADSTEWRTINAALTEKQREMAVSATKMFEGFLRQEFEADKPFYQRTLVTPGEYEKWLSQRQEQVLQLIDKGYMPLRRYGDHTVHVYIDATKPDGTPYKLSAGLSFFATAGAAQKASQIYQDEITRTGAQMKVEVGTHYKAARDVSISAQQFLDTARRNGVPLTAQEQERLVKALSSADSLTRNRMLQREGMPGYSEDGMRIMNEFGMRMSGKLAYSQFASAIDAATSGRAVDADVIDGKPVIKVDELRGAPGATESAQDFERRNLWKQEGPLSGFHHNLADELTDYVLVPDHTGGWSRKLRGAAMMYFIGGSLSSAAVNVMSVPMLTVPELSVHTPYTNAVTTTMGAWMTTWKNLRALSDIEKLKDPNVAIPGISTELRQALVAAAQYTHDTELHQIMGLSQGALFSQSRNTQRAMKAWMAPFQLSERANRITSFIAAYNVATTGEGVRQADGTYKRLSGTELFNFARDMIDKTQNNYNETNRPGAARNPVFAMLFMFKSFPLFMVEAAKLMYDQNPRAAVNMLLGLTAMTGVQGLPFAETIEDLIDTIAQHIFGSPFNTRRAMRNVLKSASEATVGYDLSDLVLRGAINSVAGVSASSRIGAGDFVPGARLGTADADQGKILEAFLGAPYAMIKDTVSNAPAMAAAAATGDWKATLDAVRAGGPIAVRNAIKGAEQLSQGYASDSKGRKLIDVSGIDGLMQMTGLSSAALAKGYELENINRQTKAFYTQVSADMQQQLVKALKANDTPKVQEIMDMRAAWNKQYPMMPMMNNSSSVRRDLALSGLPMDRRSVLMWGRQIRGENVFTENPVSGQ